MFQQTKHAKKEISLLEEKGIQVRLKSLAQNIVQKYLSAALEVPDYCKRGQ